MKKIYRILALISFLFIIGLIFLFILEISPKIKTKIYKANNDYYIFLNTNKLNQKSTTLTINNQDYKINLSIIFEKNDFYLYFLSFINLETEFNSETNAYIYLPNVSIFNYLTNNL